jgi:radical SAM superfamily enzyme YgiQ (UPF0313 family)
MRVLFSNPPWWVENEQRTLNDGRIVWKGGVRAGSRWPFTFHQRSAPDAFSFGDYLPYPFFMGYAATYLAAQTGAQTVMRDSIALKESYQSYFAYLDENRFDYIFIESATPSWEHDGALIRRLRARYPETRIVVTGPIAGNAQRILQDFPVHACIRGEYEKGAVKVIEGAEGVVDFDFLTLQEMNAAPFPYFDETIAHRYFDGNPIGQIYPHAHVWSSRGCPFKCIFCVWPATMTGNDPEGENKRTVRHYSADYMEAFLTELTAKYNFRSIYFDDDTFNLGNAHVVRMCEVMRRINLPWSAMCRADTIRMETWELMKDSGCFGVKLGFESGNQHVVDKIVNKHLDLEEARAVVHEVKRVGMSVHGTFTFGLPGETPEQMADTRRYIASLPFDSTQESGCAEIEGTPLAALSAAGTLKAYEGARIDSHYRRETDGNTKIRSLIDGMRAG